MGTNNGRTVSDLIRGITGTVGKIGRWKLKFVIPSLVLVAAIIIVGANWNSISTAYHDRQAQQAAVKLQERIVTARTKCMSDSGIDQTTLSSLSSCIGSSYLESRTSFDETFNTPYREYFSMGLPPGEIPTNISQAQWNTLYNGCLGEPLVYFGDRIPKCDFLEPFASCSQKRTQFEKSLSVSELAQYQLTRYLSKEEFTAKSNSYAKLSDTGRKNVLSYIQCMWDAVPELTRP